MRGDDALLGQVSPFAQAPREQVRDGEQAEWEI